MNVPGTKNKTPAPPGMPPDAQPFDDIIVQVKLWAAHSANAADLMCAAIQRGKAARHRRKRAAT